MQKSLIVLGLVLGLAAVGCSNRTTVRRETETIRQGSPRTVEETTTIRPAPAPQVEEHKTIIEKRSTTESVE
jgi:hypothetical protein